MSINEVRTGRRKCSRWKVQFRSNFFFLLTKLYFAPSVDLKWCGVGHRMENQTHFVYIKERKWCPWFFLSKFKKFYVVPRNCSRRHSISKTIQIVPILVNGYLTPNYKIFPTLGVIFKIQHQMPFTHNKRQQPSNYLHFGFSRFWVKHFNWIVLSSSFLYQIKFFIWGFVPCRDKYTC